MRNFIIGLIVGLIIGGGVCWAAMRVSLQDGTGNEVGTTSNPLYIEAI